MRFSIIAACDAKHGIGKQGTIPWNLKPDMEHFRSVTVGHSPSGKQNAVIMGKTTWLSLPEKFRPLPNRLNIVLSFDPLELPDGVRLAATLDEALHIASQDQAVNEIFVIGGGSVYAQTIQDPRCQTVYLTEVDHDYECDTFFPTIPGGFVRSVGHEDVTPEGITYRFVRYDRAA